MTITKIILISIVIFAVIIIYIFQINEKEQKESVNERKESVNERKEELYREYLYCNCKRPKLNGVTCFECGCEFKQR